MKILFFTTHHQSCGIADYADRLAASLINLGHEVTYFESPTTIKSKSRNDYIKSIENFVNLASSHDVVHVQHEFSFFEPWQAKLFGESLHRNGKRAYRLIATLHTTPKPLAVCNQPRSSLFNLLGMKPKPKFHDQDVRTQLEAFSVFDRILVHSRFGRNELKEFGILNPKRIKVIPMPIQPPLGESALTSKWDFVSKSLDFKVGDKLVISPGFISGAKGQLAAVKTLSLLPVEYKLILAGGVHPIGQNYGDLDHISDEIVSRNLQQRVAYTGYLDEKDLNCLTDRSDVVLLPYNIHYGSSSAIVGEALRLGKPVVATKTRGFVELAEIMSGVKLCDSPSYADIARAIVETVQSGSFDSQKIKKEAGAVSYDVIAQQTVDSFYSRSARKLATQLTISDLVTNQ